MVDPSASQNSTAERNRGLRAPLPAASLPHVLKRLAVVALIGAALVCLFLALDALVRTPGVYFDFENLYVAGSIVHKGAVKQLYDMQAQEAVAQHVAPKVRFLRFLHAPPEALLFAPLTNFSFPTAFLIWAGLNLCILAVVFYFLPRTGRRLDADSRLIWLAVCFPVVGGVLVLGQDSLLLAPVFLFAFLALKNRRDVVAGLVLGLGLFRFEILLPFVFVFLLRRRWRVLVGFTAAFATGLLTSVAMIGWSGLIKYARLLVVVGGAAGNRANGIVTAPMPSLRGAVATFFGGLIPSNDLFLVVLAGTLGLLLWAAWQFKSVANPSDPRFDLEFSLATIVALVASYDIYVHELTPLIVVAFLMLGYESVTWRNEPLLRRTGASLLLLFALVIVGGELIGFRSFSVVFVILLGLIAWLSLELSGLRPRTGAVTGSLADRSP